MLDSKLASGVQDMSPDTARDYWNTKLAGFVGTAGIIAESRRPARYRAERRQSDLTIRGELFMQLTAVSSGSLLDLYAALVAGLNICLYKYARQPRIAVGSPTLAEAVQQPAASNAVVIVSDLHSQLSVQDLLMRTVALLQAAYAAQTYPFEQVVCDLGLGDITHKCPLFDAALVLTNMHAALPILPNDLTIRLTRHEESISGTIDFNSDLFQLHEIDHFRDCFLTILSEAFTDPTITIGRINPLAPADRQRVLVDWNTTHIDYPEAMTIHELVEAQVARDPAAIALIFEDQTLTYGELNRRANQLARHLQALGIGPDRLVGVALERSFDLVVALLATLKAGGAYLPLDLTYPADRQTLMLQQSQVSTIIVHSHAIERLPKHSAQIVYIDTDWNVIAHLPNSNLGRAAVPDHLACLVYTSGTTGQPKGVMLTHRAICNSLLWEKPFFGFAAEDRLIQLAPLSFSLSIVEIFEPLYAGSKLVIAPLGAERDNEQLVDLIMRHGITILNIVPSTLKMLLEISPTRWHQSLRHVICGAEELPVQLHDRFFAALPGVSLHNVYGQSESSVDTIAWTCKREAGQRVVPVGYPISNKQSYILDADLQPVPIGVVGELYVGGAGLARGYLEHPALSAERFIPNPFCGDGDNRLYRSGDLARYRTDGAIELVGRNDFQVQIRGMRVELGEIEALLRQHPAVKEVVVDLRRSTTSSISRTPTNVEAWRQLVTACDEHMLEQQIREIEQLSDEEVAQLLRE